MMNVISRRGATAHDFADEGGYQSGLLGQADTDHCNQDDADRGKSKEVPDHGRNDESQAVRRQQAVHRGGGGLDLMRDRSIT